MNTTIEVSLFIIAVVGVIALGIWKSKDGDDSEHKKALPTTSSLAAA